MSVLNGGTRVTDDEAIALLNYGICNFTPLTLPDDDFNRLSGGTVIVPAGTRSRCPYHRGQFFRWPDHQTVLFRRYTGRYCNPGECRAQTDDAAATGQKNMEAAQNFSVSHTTAPYYIIGAIGAAFLLFFLFLMIRVIKS